MKLWPSFAPPWLHTLTSSLLSSSSTFQLWCSWVMRIISRAFRQALSRWRWKRSLSSSPPLTKFAIPFTSQRGIFLARAAQTGRMFHSRPLFLHSSVVNSVEETIFALSSGKGKAGVAIVRVSGPLCGEVVQTLTKTHCAKQCGDNSGTEESKKRKGLNPRVMHRVALIDPFDEDAPLDDCMMCFFPGSQGQTVLLPLYLFCLFLVIALSFLLVFVFLSYAHSISIFRVSLPLMRPLVRAKIVYGRGLSRAVRSRRPSRCGRSVDGSWKSKRVAAGGGRRVFSEVIRRVSYYSVKL